VQEKKAMASRGILEWAENGTVGRAPGIGITLPARHECSWRFGMSFFQWLLGKTPDRFEPPPVEKRRLTPIGDDDPMDRPLRKPMGGPVPGAPLYAPARQSDPKAAYAAQTNHPVERAEALAFIIEYEPMPGTIQRRRIRLLGVSNASTSPWINAICYERKQVRTFRLDRIRAIISPQDGTLHDPARFLIDVAGVRPELLRSSGPEEPLALGAQLRDLMRAPLSILVTAARSDGKLEPREIDAIMDWARKDALHLVREGLVLRGEKAQALAVLRDMAIMLRPDPEDLEAYVKTIRGWDSERRAQNFVDALGGVIKADGTVTETEMAFIEEFNRLGNR
jgi:tellurite resistance protein